MDKWRFGHGQCGILGIVVIVMDLQDQSVVRLTILMKCAVDC
jgi:hypothetical protein